jgi:hypothetical protein
LLLPNLKHITEDLTDPVDTVGTDLMDTVSLCTIPTEVILMLVAPNITDTENDTLMLNLRLITMVLTDPVDTEDTDLMFTVPLCTIPMEVILM